jgi:hypothetical protein
MPKIDIKKTELVWTGKRVHRKDGQGDSIIKRTLGLQQGLGESLDRI